MKIAKKIGIITALILFTIASFLFYYTQRIKQDADIQTKAITLLDDYSILFGMVKQEITDLLGDPDEIDASSKYMEAMTYKDIVLYGKAAKVTLLFDALQSNQLTQIHISICVNDENEAQQLCKTIEDNLISKFRLMNISFSQRELPGETALCTEHATYYIDPNASSGTEQYTDIYITLT